MIRILPCPAGTYSPAGRTKLASSDQCIGCPSGSFCDGQGGFEVQDLNPLDLVRKVTTVVIILQVQHQIIHQFSLKPILMVTSPVMPDVQKVTIVQMAQRSLNHVLPVPLTTILVTKLRTIVNL